MEKFEQETIENLMKVSSPKIWGIYVSISAPLTTVNLETEISVSKNISFFGSFADFSVEPCGKQTN